MGGGCGISADQLLDALPGRQPLLRQRPWRCVLGGGGAPQGRRQLQGGENEQSFRYESQKVVHASFADYTAIAEWLETWLPDATFIFKEGFTFVTGDDPVDGWPSMPVPGGARLDQSSRRSNTYEPQFSTEVKMISLAIHRHLLDLATLLDHTMAFDASSPKINVAA